MKRFTQICLLITALCFALAAQAQQASKDKPRIAVLEFKNKADNQWWYHGGAEAAQDVFVTELMKAMQDVFVTELMKAKRFSVMDRKELETTAATQQLTLSGDIDPSTAIALGKSLGVNYILAGALTEYGVTDKRSGKGRAFVAAINARLIDTSTGEIVWADEARSEEASFSSDSAEVKDVRTFKKTVKPCVDRLISKWRASRRLDWQRAK
ncbi:MAG: CsgG/HfaB family protein [bacterium]